MNVDAIRGLSQPDQTTCGPSSLVAAHMLVDPAYAATQNPHAFASTVLALHKSLTSTTFAGHTQMPWPPQLGTPPWAAANAMESFTGHPYESDLVRFGSRTSAFSRVVAAVTAGLPCPLYVGSTWVPRHVVLAVAPTADGVQVYNPGRGSIDDLTRASFLSGELTIFGSWDHPWFAVVPKG